MLTDRYLGWSEVIIFPIYATLLSVFCPDGQSLTPPPHTHPLRLVCGKYEQLSMHRANRSAKLLRIVHRCSRFCSNRKGTQWPFFSCRGEAIAGCRFSFHRKHRHADMKPALLTAVFSVYFKFTSLITSDLCFYLEDLKSAFMKNTVFLSLVLKVES